MTLTAVHGQKSVSRAGRPDYRPDVVAEILQDGRTVYVATHPSYPGVIAQGDTEAEALSGFKECFRAYRRYMKKVRVPLPECTRFTFATVRF